MMKNEINDENKKEIEKKDWNKIRDDIEYALKLKETFDVTLQDRTIIYNCVEYDYDEDNAQLSLFNDGKYLCARVPLDSIKKIS